MPDVIARSRVVSLYGPRPCLVIADWLGDESLAQFMGGGCNPPSLEPSPLGPRGEGSSEGGLQPPPINWARLSSPSQSAITRQGRGPYNETTLERAITSGIISNGGRLHPGMPHYKMTAEQMADLIAYLKRLGEAIDTDPGLSEDIIKVGAALPMTGSLANIGEDVKKALGAYFTEINKEGGVYGRKF